MILLNSRSRVKSIRSCSLRMALAMASFSMLGACSSVNLPLDDGGGLLLKAAGGEIKSIRAPVAEYGKLSAKISFADNEDACLEKWKREKEAGILAWCESYVLNDFLDRLEYERDLQAAKAFLRHADEIMKHYNRKSRDRQRGGRHTAGWPSKRYSKGKASYWLVHTGQIIRNFARFAHVAKKHKIKRHARDAKRLAGISRAFFKSYDVDWDGTKYHEAGQRDERSPSASALPLNMQATFGITAIYLYRYYGTRHYYDRALRINSYLLNSFRIVIDKKGIGVTWPYRENSGTEDTSHALLTLSFIHLAMLEGIGVSENEYRNLVKSFASRTLRGKTNFSYDVVGQRPGTGPKIADNCYRMLHVARYNAELWNICRKVAADKSGRREKS